METTHLGNETGDGSVLLVEGLVDLGVGTLSLGQSLGLGLKSLLRNLGKLGESEEEGNNNTHTSDGEVDEACEGLVTARH